MNKSKKITVIVICSTAVLLLVSLFVAAGILVAKDGAQGLIGEWIGNTAILQARMPSKQKHTPAKKVTGGASEELITQQGESATVQDVFDYTTLFDFDMQHKPTYEECLKIYDNMTVEQVVELLGRPHGMDAAAGSKYLIWTTEDGGRYVIKVVSRHSTENPTDWSEILVPNYGGAIVSYHYYSGTES